ncbi:hypothetical protein ACVWYN_002922 [Pedobacter sp. UYP24]
MEWLTTETEYEGFPLYLRVPKYKNIWLFKSNNQNRVCITHNFDKVKENGLPSPEYNKTLSDFDDETVNLLIDNGIIFLVETYGGARNYWYYVKDSKQAIQAFDLLKNNHSDKQLEFDISNDSEWDFLDEYPIKLYGR